MLAIATSDFLSRPLVLLASVWIGVWAFTRWRKLRKKTTFKTPLSGVTPPEPVNPSPRSAPSKIASVLSSSDVRALATELQTLLADLADTSRAMAAQMDNRKTRIETLMTEADKKIKTLESLMAQAPSGGRSSHGPEIDDHAHLDLSCLTTRLASQMNSISKTARSAAPVTQTRASADILHAPADPLHRKIYELADKGQSSRDIAQTTGKHQGEVELILGLRRR